MNERTYIDKITDINYGIIELKKAIQYKPLMVTDIINYIPNWYGFFNYACLNVWGEPIYIGRTINLKRRLEIHKRYKKSIVFFWIAEFETYHDMIKNETIMINKIKPILNYRMSNLKQE